MPVRNGERAPRGPLRFASHRDLARALERALRRAQVPMAFSAGFSPHPKISYIGAAPTGAASEAEYLEIGLADRRDPEAVREAWQRFYFKGEIPENMGPQPQDHVNKRRLKAVRLGL